MRLIKSLANQIKDELDGACEYASGAIEQKSARPALARLYARISETELAHASWLHEIASSEIAYAERTGSKPTQEMVDKWNESHKELIEKTADVRAILKML